MARIRSIKPEFWTSEQIVECSTSARLLFIGMWSFADDGGNLPASFKTLKMQIFPADNIDVEPLVAELFSVGLLIEYTVNSRNYWNITGWHHQKIDRPTYKYPRLDEGKIVQYSTSPRRALDEPSTTERRGEDIDKDIDNYLSIAVGEDEREPENIQIKKIGRKTEDLELLAEVGEGWNDLAASLRLPQIGKLTESRKNLVLARAKELVSDYDFPTPREGFQIVFGKIRGSPFLRGDSGQWRADFDFVFKQSNFTKILEGKYENQQKVVNFSR